MKLIRKSLRSGWKRSVTDNGKHIFSRMDALTYISSDAASGAVQFFGLTSDRLTRKLRRAVSSVHARKRPLQWR